MKTAACPSCGAPVSFRSPASLYAVCEFCRSTLLRQGDDLQNLGRMADLLEDASLIQIGTEGRFRGQHFAVIGRIQLQHEAGIWNEWHILFDDGRNAWLSEASGEYVVSAQLEVSEPVPAFESLLPETAVTLAGRNFTVTDLETARCISGQGELPFRVAAGYDVNTADLRGNDRFVTLDYSETPPLVFAGHSATFKDLNFANLREAANGNGATIEAKAFNCPHCAAPLTIHSGAIESIGCESCGSIIGVENDNLRLLAAAAQTVHEIPALEIGSKGRLNGVEWEVIGFLKRRTTVEGVDYDWAEYLLFSAGEGFAWLVEDQGHWNFVRTQSDIPQAASGQDRFFYQGLDYRRFNAGRAEVTYVAGEFYWRVAVGESCATDDYISPPYMLSREVTDKEVSWSLGEYLPVETLRAAFRPKIPLPRPKGVYANQPNPNEERHRGICRLFWKLAALAIVVQLIFVLLSTTGTVLKYRFVMKPAQVEGTVVTPEFELKSKVRSLRVSHQTDLNNNWVSLMTTLVEKNTGQAWQGAQEISYYRGVDGGESWSEGSQNDAIVFKTIPPGTYYLAIDYEMNKGWNASVVDSVEVARNAPGWSNFVFVMLFLAMFPLLSRWRRSAFEEKRWYESSLGQEADDGDDDD